MYNYIYIYIYIGYIGNRWTYVEIIGTSKPGHRVDVLNIVQLSICPWKYVAYFSTSDILDLEIIGPSNLLFGFYQ